MLFISSDHFGIISFYKFLPFKVQMYTEGKKIINIEKLPKLDIFENNLEESQ